MSRLILSSAFVLCSLLVIFAFVPLITCAGISGGKLKYSKQSIKEPQRPLLAPHFTMKWRIVASTNDNSSIPLDWHPLPPKNVKYMLGTGTTYYDWSQKAMLEVYDDYCVPIFGPLTDKINQFRCNFLNVNLTSYLISLDPSPFPKCCVFGEQVFHPPEPTFLNNMFYNSSAALFGKPVDWWVLDTDQNDPAEPFGYGFYPKDQVSGYQTPAAFWFRTVDGFSIQYFKDFEVKKPDPSVWKLPSYCVNAPSCGYL